jgi:hypothetical protein
MYPSEVKVFDPALDLERRTADRSRSLFLRGPISFEWINQACLDPAARLAFIIRAFMDMKHTREVRVSMEICRYAGIADRRQRWRCLHRLARTGLFEISTARGRSPIVGKLW